MPTGVYRHITIKEGRKSGGGKKGKTGTYNRTNFHKDIIRRCMKKLYDGGVKMGFRLKNYIRKGEQHPNWKGGISFYPQYASFVAARRNLKKLSNGGSHTLCDWETLKAQYNWTCPCCKKCEPEIKLTEDHIIPVSKGGTDNIENLQPLCKSCNSKKMTKIIKF